MLRPTLITFALTASLFAMVVAALAQQPETGPKADPKGQHPLRGQETGVRGPSGSSPETGPHGQRDVTKDAEPGKSQTPAERRQTGQVPAPPSKMN